MARIPAPGFTTFGLHQIMEDITNLLRANQIVFSYSINPTDISIMADRGQIEQVLINLIKNAWEARSQNEAPVIGVKIEKDIYQRPLILISDKWAGYSTRCS